MVYHRYDGSWVEVICGSMLSGETERLIRVYEARCRNCHPVPGKDE